MKEQVEQIIDRHSHAEGRVDLVAILHEVNSTQRYLSREALEMIAQKLAIPLSRLYSMAAFYRSFNLEPRGDHEVHICLGTACHVRGGERIFDRLSERLGIGSGETTSDRKFTINRVNCVGACALGPLVVIDGRYYGRLDPLKAERLLEEYYEQA